MDQELLHIKEVAKLLGVTRQAVYKKLTALGRKPTKVGSKSFIDVDTLKEIKEGKKKVQPPVAKVSPSVAEDGDTATKQVDTDLVNLLIQQVEELKSDKVALQRQVDIKDRQIEDLSNSGREMRLLLGNAQQQISGLLPAPAEPHQPDYESSTPDHNQPDKMKSSKKQKGEKEKKKKKNA